MSNNRKKLKENQAYMAGKGIVQTKTLHCNGSSFDVAFTGRKTDAMSVCVGSMASSHITFRRG